jgi:hypothetical protein
MLLHCINTLDSIFFLLIKLIRKNLDQIIYDFYLYSMTKV